MKITLIGACETVTGSKFLVEEDGLSLLVDCGLYQGKKSLRNKNWEEFPFDVKELDAVLLTHAHLDHSGLIPRLVKQGFQGKIYCTKPTFELVKILLIDSANIQEEDAAYANKEKISKHKPALPLYNLNDAQDSFSFFSPMEDYQVLSLGSLKIQFHFSGHILGASSILIENKIGKRILFSGDIGRQVDPIYFPPEPPPEADIVVMESTYGDRLHDRVNPLNEFQKVLSQITQKGGILLIPAFAVARAQLVLYYLYELFKRNPDLEVPVYLNSPMTEKVCDLYERSTHYHRLDLEYVKNLMEFPKRIEFVNQSKKLNEQEGPFIVISASGMLTGGRVLHHLRAFGKDPGNMILLAGYQAEETRGADLVAGVRELTVHGGRLKIKAQVEQFHFLSAHADQPELLQWLKATKTKNVYLVHGEEQSLKNFRDKIKEDLKIEAEVGISGHSFELL